MSTVSFVDICCEFIEIAINHIVYLRKIYPETIFAPKRKYGVIVYKIQQPDINNYITECLKTINYHLKHNQLTTILLCFWNNSKFLDRINFNIRNIRQLIDSDEFLIKFEENIRDFFLKVSTSFEPVVWTDDAKFTINLEVTEYSSVAFNQEPAYENFPWIHVKDKTDETLEITPIDRIKLDLLDLQVYLEQVCIGDDL